MYRNKNFFSPLSMQEFFKLIPAYQNLIDEISFILDKKLSDEKIELAHITKRIKSVESFVAKIQSKHYDDPLKEVTDIAGVRVVFLYLDDIEKIESVIRKAFIVVEKVEKAHDGIDRFGYLASHYIVKVRKPIVGERYSILKGLKCEIQVRTVVQDSWAILSHHLIYKNNKEVPKLLQRRVNQLAAVLENADQQFNDIEEKRRLYLSRLNNPNISLNELMSEECNKDSILVYLQRKFPNLPLKSYDWHAEFVLQNFNLEEYPTLTSIDNLIEKTKEARTNYSRIDSIESSLSHLALAKGCVDKTYRQLTVFGESARLVFDAFDKLLKRNVK